MQDAHAAADVGAQRLARDAHWEGQQDVARERRHVTAGTGEIQRVPAEETRRVPEVYFRTDDAAGQPRGRSADDPRLLVDVRESEERSLRGERLADERLSGLKNNLDPLV